LGNRLVDLLDPQAAIAVLSTESDQRRQVEAPNRRRALLFSLAESLYRSGDVVAARRLISEYGLRESPVIALLQGDWEEAEKSLVRQREGALTREHLADRVNANLSLAQVRSMRDDPSSLELLTEAVSTALSGPAKVLVMRSGPELAINLALTGRADEAAPILKKCREVAAEGEDWRGRAGRLALAEAAVAFADGDETMAERHFAEALAVFERYSLPWDTAGAYLMRGRLLARLGRRNRPLAAASFDEALAIYKRLDAANVWTETATTWRARSLGRTAVTGRVYPDRLSEREVEVLRLIAQGRSNREISEALVLSVRTVERHITNIYTKIGARGKADATAYALRHNLS
jgi:DNA-binding CsgD family transcriptional regulator